jgi:hypothetical protein
MPNEAETQPPNVSPYQLARLATGRRASLTAFHSRVSSQAESHKDANVVIPREISDLKWIFDNELWNQDQAWKSAENNRKGVGEAQDQRYGEPTWGQAPTRSPLRAIDEYLRHLADLWRSMDPLQLSESWKVSI